MTGKYQKYTQLEHVLARPDTYVGSIEKEWSTKWVLNKEKTSMVEKPLDYVPGLYKIFDEILVNAADNKQRDPKGLYKKALSGQLPNMTGIHSPYEAPLHPNVVIDNNAKNVSSIVANLAFMVIN